MTDRDTGNSAPFETFEDPALKAVVRHAWGSERCSPDLRERVCCLCEARSSVGWRIGRWAGWGIAAAAVVALAVGISITRRLAARPVPLAIAPLATPASPPALHSGSLALATPAAVSSDSLIPVALQNNLVSTHERCVHRANHHGLDHPGSNDVTIADAMRARLSHAVLVARPRQPGWLFHGAAICRVGATPCGHLVFSRGDSAISIFSLPASADPAIHDSIDAHAVANGHPMVAFARDGALFCLVGSGPAGSISVDDLDRMRQRMEPNVTADAPEHGAALAELLIPIGP